MTKRRIRLIDLFESTGQESNEQMRLRSDQRVEGSLSAKYRGLISDNSLEIAENMAVPVPSDLTLSSDAISSLSALLSAIEGKYTTASVDDLEQSMTAALKIVQEEKFRHLFAASDSQSAKVSNAVSNYQEEETRISAMLDSYQDREDLDLNMTVITSEEDEVEDALSAAVNMQGQAQINYLVQNNILIKKDQLDEILSRGNLYRRKYHGRY